MPTFVAARELARAAGLQQGQQASVAGYTFTAQSFTRNRDTNKMTVAATLLVTRGGRGSPAWPWASTSTSPFRSTAAEPMHGRSRIYTRCRRASERRRRAQVTA